ncbi:hypothetical protein XENOCAPTIV_018783 [Xenoophorus captivus]|uniref:CCHC-type domain-containing protein n=1 Tax=Xenoophorus captivus TaxID=1517983 RepID=A0ABV0SGV2_9TELE
MYAEKVVSGKKKQPPTDTFYVEDEIFYAGPVSRRRGRMRGVFRRNGGLRGRGRRQVRGRDDGRDDVCWVCGQHGHWARNVQLDDPVNNDWIRENRMLLKKEKGKLMRKRR